MRERMSIRSSVDVVIMAVDGFGIGGVLVVVGGGIVMVNVMVNDGGWRMAMMAPKAGW